MHTGAEVASQMYASFSRAMRCRSKNGRATVPTTRHVIVDSMNTPSPTAAAISRAPRRLFDQRRRRAHRRNPATPPLFCIHRISTPMRIVNATMRACPGLVRTLPMLRAAAAVAASGCQPEWMSHPTPDAGQQRRQRSPAGDGEADGQGRRQEREPPERVQVHAAHRIKRVRRRRRPGLRSAGFACSRAGSPAAVVSGGRGRPGTGSPAAVVSGGRGRPGTCGFSRMGVRSARRMTQSGSCRRAVRGLRRLRRGEARRGSAGRKRGRRARHPRHRMTTGPDHG